MRTIILGAGGHAQVVADILLLGQSKGEPWQPIGYLDDNPALHGQCFLGLPVLGSLAQLPSVAHEAVIIGIGHNRTRCEIFMRLQLEGERFANAIHPAAFHSPFATLGVGTMICAGAMVTTGAIIGDNVILNTGCSVSHHSRTAAHCHIAPGSRLGGEASLGEGALVGIGATVMPRRSVGAWSTVGAGAVVAEDVPDGATVVGVPARPMHRKR